MPQGGCRWSPGRACNPKGQRVLIVGQCTVANGDAILVTGFLTHGRACHAGLCPRSHGDPVAGPTGGIGTTDNRVVGECLRARPAGLGTFACRMGVGAKRLRVGPLGQGTVTLRHGIFCRGHARLSNGNAIVCRGLCLRANHDDVID